MELSYLQLVATVRRSVAHATSGVISDKELLNSVLLRLTETPPGNDIAESVNFIELFSRPQRQLLAGALRESQEDSYVFRPFFFGHGPTPDYAAMTARLRVWATELLPLLV